jgi:hypothetical protein
MGVDRWMRVRQARQGGLRTRRQPDRERGRTDEPEGEENPDDQVRPQQPHLADSHGVAPQTWQKKSNRVPGAAVGPGAPAALREREWRPPRQSPRYAARRLAADAVDIKGDQPVNPTSAEEDSTRWTGRYRAYLVIPLAGRARARGRGPVPAPPGGSAGGGAGDRGPRPRESLRDPDPGAAPAAASAVRGLPRGVLDDGRRAGLSALPGPRGRPGRRDQRRGRDLACPRPDRGVWAHA